MITNTFKHYRQSALYALIASVFGLTLLFMSFSVAEPTISHGQSATSTFTIKQQINDETSFLVEPANVVMAGGGISGVTGGQATGTTQFSVISNNAAGYRVDIAFEDDDADGEAMLGDLSLTGDIKDYGFDDAGEPSYGFFASTTQAQFAYTVTSSTTADTDPSFHNDGIGDCNAGSTETPNFCWKAPDSSAFTIVDRDNAAITGATSTITFSVYVPSGASPQPQAQTYTATATLSLYTN